MRPEQARHADIKWNVVWTIEETRDRLRRSTEIIQRSQNQTAQVAALDTLLAQWGHHPE